MVMITLEEPIDTYKGFNTSKNLIIIHAKCFTIDAGMASTTSVTVVTSTSSHSTRRPHSTTVTQHRQRNQGAPGKHLPFSAPPPLQTV